MVKSMIPLLKCGVKRIMFIGCLKVTTILLLCFFSLVAAPNYYYSPEQPAWVVGAVLLCGIIPFAFVHYITNPWVTFVHLRLPAYARENITMVKRYARILPGDAAVDITTMNFISRQRISRILVSNIRPKTSRFGIQYYERINMEKRKWWQPKPPAYFLIGDQCGIDKNKELWGYVRRAFGKWSFGDGWKGGKNRGAAAMRKGGREGDVRR